jgi:hypothetical protein
VEEIIKFPYRQFSFLLTFDRLPKYALLPMDFPTSINQTTLLKQMQTISGFVHHEVGQHNISCNFVTDAGQSFVYPLAGDLSEVPTFRVSDATLTTDDPYEVERTASGTVGPELLTLKFPNGSVIQGKLDSPLQETYPFSL